MTTPTTPATTPSTSAPADVVAAGVVESQQADDRLGTNWKLRFATITEVSSSTMIYGRFDGDTSGQVPLISLIGTPANGARIAVITVPPSGNYIIANLTVSAPILKLSETILTASAASVTFSSISQLFRTLQLTVMARTDQAATFTSTLLRINGDTGANYDTSQIEGTGVAVNAGEIINGAGIYCSEVSGNNAPAGACGIQEITVPFYTGTTFWKSAIILDGHARGTGSGTQFSKYLAGRWRNTAAVTSLTVFPNAGNFVAGSSFALYGLI